MTRLGRVNLTSPCMGSLWRWGLVQPSGVDLEKIAEGSTRDLRPFAAPQSPPWWGWAKALCPPNPHSHNSLFFRYPLLQRLLAGYSELQKTG